MEAPREDIQPDWNEFEQNKTRGIGMFQDLVASDDFRETRTITLPFYDIHSYGRSEGSFEKKIHIRDPRFAFSFSLGEKQAQVTLGKTTTEYNNGNNEDSYTFRLVCSSLYEGQKCPGVAQLIFVRRENTWDLVDRFVDPILRGGTGTKILSFAEECIQSYADKGRSDQVLVASNVGQLEVAKWLHEKNGWQFQAGQEERYELMKSAGEVDSPLTVKSDPSNPDAQNWIYNRDFLRGFEAHYGDIFKVQKCWRRPYIYESFLVGLEKRLQPNIIAEIQHSVRQDIL